MITYFFETFKADRTASIEFLIIVTYDENKLWLAVQQRLLANFSIKYSVIHYKINNRILIL